MEYGSFLKRVIDEGIAAATEDYTKNPDPAFNSDRLEGSIAGFNACRDKLPHELVEVYKEATEYAHQAFCDRSEKYWWFRCYQIEIEWVCNVVSAGMKMQLLSHLPTYRGVMKASNILGMITL